MRSRVRSSAGWLAAACLGLLMMPAPLAAQTVTSASVTGTVRDASEAVVARRDRRHQESRYQSGHVDGHRQPRPIPAAVSAGRRLSPVGAAPGLHDREREPDAGGRRSGGRAHHVAAPARAGRIGRRSRRWRRSSRCGRDGSGRARRYAPEESTALPLNGRNYLDLALLAPNVSRTQRAHRRIASPETSAVPEHRHLRRRPAQSSATRFIVDGLSANDDAADLAGTHLRRGSDSRVPGGDIRRRRGVRPRVEPASINIVTQSGTNPRAGRAYGFFRNDARRARMRDALAIVKDPADAEPVRFHASAGRSRRIARSGSATSSARSLDKHGHRDHRAGATSRPSTASSTRPITADRASTTGSFPTGYDHDERVRARRSSGDIARRGCSCATTSTRRQPERARASAALNDVSRGDASDRHRSDGRRQRVSRSLSSSCDRRARGRSSRGAGSARRSTTSSVRP